MKTARACLKCGTVFDTRNCLVCARERNAARRRRDPDRVKSNNAKFRKNNPAYGSEWQKANREKSNAYTQKWVAANPEKVKAQQAARDQEQKRAYFRAHKEEVKARSLAWRKANPEKYRAYVAAWSKANSDRRRLHQSNRRARVRANGGEFSKNLIKKLWALQKGRCACCGKPLGNRYHVDHIVPIFLGGTNTDDNAQLLRDLCNLQKATKHPVDFMQSRGFLL
jgi:hypothetical protein